MRPEPGRAGGIAAQPALPARVPPGTACPPFPRTVCSQDIFFSSIFLSFLFPPPPHREFISPASVYLYMHVVVFFLANECRLHRAPLFSPQSLTAAFGGFGRCSALCYAAAVCLAR